MSYILITGGLGYIGSHICLELLHPYSGQQNYNIIIIDNLSHSSIDVLDKLRSSWNEQTKLIFYQNNYGDLTILNEIFSQYLIYAVIHLAAYKSTKLSCLDPLSYYDNNVSNTINLLMVMNEYNCKKIIYSSSATVYGDAIFPVSEDQKVGLNITNPYGQSKYFIEKILEDCYHSNNEWSIIILRYFNPIGAHPSGLLGDNLNDIPENLFPYILKVIRGDLDILNIFGNDYNTLDGTCIRDYIHICDLSEAHVLSIKKFIECGVHIYNLGYGQGISVLELVQTFQSICGINIPYKFVDRRQGDLPVVYADITKATMELGWYPKRTIEEMCLDGYRYLNI